MNTKNKKILLVEDNEDIVVMLKSVLELKGYEVTHTSNFDNIENLALEVPADLIIMDMLLSGDDGRHICRSLKANPQCKDIPVIMTSAHPNAKKECLGAGADHYIEKPFEMKEFFSLIEKALKLKQA